MIEICPVAAANPAFSAGYWYRMVQPMQALDVTISEDPEALRVIFGCWNDLRPEHYQGRYILDFDDLIWDQPRTQYPDIQRLFEVMRGAAHITVASPYLRQKIQQLGRMPQVTYCRTGVQDDYYPMVMEPESPVIAWRGSKGWYRALDWVKSYLPNDLSITQGLPFKDYMKMLKTYDRTLELCPSYPGAFEMAKSNIKLLQALHQGVPVIASELHPYGWAALEAKQLVFRDPSEIPGLVKRVLDSKALREELSVQGRVYTLQSWRIEHTAEDFLSVWSRYA